MSIAETAPAAGDAAGQALLPFEQAYWRSAPVTLRAPPLDPGRLSDAEFRLLADNLPTLCWIATGDGYIAWYNRRWYEYSGTTPKEMEGWGWQAVHDPDVLPAVLERWTGSIATGEPFDMVFPLKGADGLFRPFLTRVQPVRDARGAVVRWFGVNTEISAQIAAERAVTDADRRQQSQAALLGQLTEGVIIADAEGRITFVNEAAERLHGVKSLQVAPEDYSETYHLFTEDGRPYPPLELPLARAVTRGETVLDARWLIRRPDGTEILAIGSARPLLVGGERAGGILTLRDDTDRHRAELALRSERDLSQALLENMTDGFVLLDRNYVVRAINAESLRMEGRPREDFIGRTHWDIWPGTEGGELHQLYARVIEHGEIVGKEHLFAFPAGHQGWLEMRAYPAPDGGVAIVYRDVTERKQREQALRESEERLRLVVDGASDYAIFTTDPERIITSWSKGAEAVFGYTAGAAIGQCGDMLWTEEDRAVRQPELEINTARAEGCANDERWHLRADGSRVFLNGSVHPLPRYDDGRERGFIKIARDETERRRAETALKDSEEQLRLVLDAAPGGFYSVDTEGHTTLVSRGFLAMMGFAGEEEVLGRKLHGLIHHTHPDGSPYPVEDCPIYRCASAGEAAYVADEIFFRLDGTQVPVEYRVSPIMRDGERIGAVCTIADLTQRKAAEAAVRESEQRFRNMADHAPVMMWVTEADGYCTYLNRAWYEFTGQTEAEAQGYGWLDATHPDDKPVAEQAFLTSNANHAPFRVEYRLRRRDGAYRWAIDAASPRFAPDGGFLGYVGSVIDIDERREIEDALRGSESLYRALAEAIGRVVWTTRPDGSVVDMPQWRALTGQTPEQVAGHGWLEALHPEDREPTATAWQAALDAREPVDVEYRIRRADGTYRWYNSRGVPVLDDAGAIREWVGVVIDIDDRKLAEAALREESARLETLNRTGSALAGELDLERLVQMVTDAGLSLTGARYGAFFYNVAHEGEPMLLYALSGAERSDFERFGLPRPTAIFSPTFAGEGAIRSDDILTDHRYGKNHPHKGMPDGHVPVRSYLAVPVASRSGEVIGGLFFGHPEPARFTERHEELMTGIAAQAAIAIDNARLYEASRKEIEERVRAEERLRELNETLEQRVAAEVAQRSEAEEQLRQMQKMETLGQLTGGVAHDFNNLLQIVTGNLEILQRNLPEDQARLRRSADNAMRGAERAAVLTQRLLAFARRQPLEPKPISLNKLVGGMSELLHRTLGETFEVETVLASGLWNVEADPNQLENAIINLAVNARDAMPGGGKLTIETSNTHLDHAYAAQNTGVVPGQYVVVCVSDTGSGMDAETLGRVFEPFFTTKEVGRGTGLGLSMVYGFVKQSGGHVKIYSEAGQGTTVKLYLPRQMGAVAEEEITADPLIPEGTREETILVCEDDDDVRTYSVEVLRELGYRVLEAHDGPSALRLLERQDGEVDLLFTDVVLPSGMMGDKLAAEARRLRPGLKVLFTTGYARNAIVHHGRLDPGVELITKPFTYADLAARIRDLLDGG